ncbi:M48 family metallopeptidase [Candidatus Parcubacteria bacterium]|nr:M48 family metallopeptidase [Candidatus Parcubacteria bacterium]
MLLLRRNRRQYLKVKEDARMLVHARVAYFNLHYKSPVKKIFIKNHKSRWGSCSSKGNLNFNYKILYLPPVMQDYIIVHELCHLHQFNHSPKFWALVAQTVPNHRTIRAALRKLERGVAKIL